MNYFTKHKKVSKVRSSAIFISIPVLFFIVMFLLSDLVYADPRSRKELERSNDSIENNIFAKDRNLLNTLGQVNSYSGSKPKTELKSRLTLSASTEAIDDNIYVKDRKVRPIKKGVASGSTPSLQTQFHQKNGETIAQTIESRNKSRVSNANRDQVSKTVSAQAKNIQRLYQETVNSGGFDAQFNESHGTPRFIKGQALTPKLQLNKTDLAISQGVARNFLSKNAALFKLDDPTTELIIHRQHFDNLGKKHFHFQQKYKDLPVWGKQLSIHLDDHDSVYFINGTHIPTPKNLDVTPQISEDNAIDLTTQHLHLIGSIQLAPIFRIFKIRALVEPLAELVIYPSADGLLRLAYKVEILPN